MRGKPPWRARHAVTGTEARPKGLGAKTPEGRRRQSEGAKALWAERSRLMALAREMEQAAP